jgi:protoheme ferro-lyase
MNTRNVVLLTYGEPPTPDFFSQLRYSWRILLGLTRSVAPIPPAVVPIIALARAHFRWRLWSRERYGSPLERLTRVQAEGLHMALDARQPEVRWRVHVAYEFRDPLLLCLLESLPESEPVDIVPMYAAESAFTHEISRRMIDAWRRFPHGRPAPIRVMPALDEEALAEVSARLIDRELSRRGIGGRDWALVLAAHGTLLEPPRPMETGRLATERIGGAIAKRLESRFGTIVQGWLNHVYGGRWTEPPIEEALRRVVNAGFRRAVYFPFGFLADNAESQLEGRIALRGQQSLEAVHLDCLNAAPELLDLIARQVAGETRPATAATPAETVHASLV